MDKNFERDGDTEGKEVAEGKEDPCRFVYRKFLGEWNKLNYEVARFKGWRAFGFLDSLAAKPRRQQRTEKLSVALSTGEVRPAATSTAVPSPYHTADNPFWSLFWR